MAAKPKKTRSRGLEKQFADIEDLHRRASAGSLLNVKSKDELHIDEFVRDYGKGDRHFLRSSVERIARSVLDSVVYLYDWHDGSFAIGEKAIQTIAKVDRETRWLRELSGLELSALMFTFTRTDAAFEEKLPPKFAWPELINALNEVHELYSVLKGKYRNSSPKRGGRSEILTHLFVCEMSDFHRRQFGRHAPRSKSGRFVRFMQSAWLDLRFPAIPDDALGYKAERLPRL